MDFHGLFVKFTPRLDKKGVISQTFGGVDSGPQGVSDVPLVPLLGHFRALSDHE